MNTTFELLTGYSSNLFREEGAIPNQHFIRQPLSALPRTFVRAGFHSKAVHPNVSYFYNRNIVLPFMGFEEFQSLRFFRGAAKSHGFVDDEAVVARTILNSQLECPLFQYVLTISTHGPYVRSRIDNYQPRFLSRTDGPWEELEVYSQLIHQADENLKRLVDYFAMRREPTVIIALGDHVPPLSMDLVSQLKSAYEVPYVVWSNTGLSRRPPALISSMYMGNEILRLAGVEADRHFQFSRKMAREVKYISKTDIEFRNGTRLAKACLFGDVPSESCSIRELARLQPFWLWQYDGILGQRFFEDGGANSAG